MANLMTTDNPLWIAMYIQQQRIARKKRAESGGDVVLPDPTTVSFSSAQFSPGLTGSLSTTKVAGKIYGRGDRTIWAGFISGSEAVLQYTTDWGGLQCSVDGGAFVDCTKAGNLYTCFSGLDSSAKFIQIRMTVDWVDSSYIEGSGMVLTVTGQPPSITPVSTWLNSDADSILGFYNGAVVSNLANYSPKLQLTRNDSNGSSIGSMKLRGAFASLVVAVTGVPYRVGISKNGGTPTFYDSAYGGPSIRCIRIPCDGTLATYHVWDNGTGMSFGGQFAVGVDAPLQDIGTRVRLDQYGDSITYGASATPAEVETMQVAAALGYTGSTHGVSGHNCYQLSVLLDAVLPYKTITSSDIAVLAIGRNDADNVDAAVQGYYSDCIDKLLAKGYGKILCRAILPSPGGGELWTTPNAALQSVVTAKANANVIWIPTSTWTTYSAPDGTHPSAAGYVELAALALPVYSAALGIT